MRPFSVPHAMRLRGKKKSFGIGASRLFDGYAFLRLAGIISFFGHRFVMPTSSAIRPPAPRSLWYSRVKCGSYLGANEDRFFNWRAKIKFALLKINKLRHLVFLLEDDAANMCFMIGIFKNETNSRDSSLLFVNFINAFNVRIIIGGDDIPHLFAY